MEATVIVSWQYEESNEVRNVLVPSFCSGEIIATGRGVHPFTLDKLKIGAYETIHSKLEQTVDEKTNARRLIGTLSFGSTFEGTVVEAEVQLPVGTPTTDLLPAMRKITRNAIDTLVRLKERRSEASTDEADTFKLRFRDTPFVTDRVTLEEHSQFFRCFFSSCFSFKEHDQGYMKSDFDPEVGEIIQTYLTTGRIEKVKLEENLKGFMRFVHGKQFLELVAIGEVMMAQSALDALTGKDMQGIVGILSLGAQLDLTMIVLLGNLLEQEYFSEQGEEEVGRKWELRQWPRDLERILGQRPVVQREEAHRYQLCEEGSNWTHSFSLSVLWQTTMFFPVLVAFSLLFSHAGRGLLEFFDGAVSRF
ncbi:hypothetical protein RvY_08076 [Ramazzottius varieornatus]|uniref:BTB domain-containing protein n=1 Tax=Ramazzottius varieornatus TaxID=947166 RepID=A0A1D1V4H9_RAMVA|nr:hypothetical protein RvY_08076 [Ramazzottius varieornatus]